MPSARGEHAGFVTGPLVRHWAGVRQGHDQPPPRAEQVCQQPGDFLIDDVVAALRFADAAVGRSWYRDRRYPEQSGVRRRPRHHALVREWAQVPGRLSLVEYPVGQGVPPAGHAVLVIVVQL